MGDRDKQEPPMNGRRRAHSAELEQKSEDDEDLSAGSFSSEVDGSDEEEYDSEEEDTVQTSP